MAAARARGALACPSSARHCASFAWRTRLPRKPKWRILWNPLMQCTALTGLCRPQRYVDLTVDVSHKYMKLGHFYDEYPRIALHNLTVYLCVHSTLDRRRVVR